MAIDGWFGRVSGWRTMVSALGCCMATLLFVQDLGAEVTTETYVVSAGESERKQTPVSIDIVLPDAFRAAAEAGAPVAIADDKGNKITGQLSLRGLRSPMMKLQAGNFHAQLHFVVPALAKGATATYTATIASDAAKSEPSFKWTDTAGQYSELSFGDRPVLRYMYAALDESTKEKRSETFKPYHHLYDPAGKVLLTKGPGGLFPHHRGMFFGFNRISYGENKKADTWHCNKGEFQSHEKFLSIEAGPVMGRHTVEIAWHGQDGAVFAREEREFTVYNVAGGTLVEFASLLKSEVEGEIKLDGDPQHAGFQFRATQAVPDKTADKTYYLRPDGKDKPGSFRNWPAQKEHVNLPWNAVSFVVGEQRYTVCYLDHTSNPKESRFSERNYARFGSYFEYTLDKSHPLMLSYRIFATEGELEVPDVERMDQDLVAPPAIKSKS